MTPRGRRPRTATVSTPSDPSDSRNPTPTPLIDDSAPSPSPSSAPTTTFPDLIPDLLPFGSISTFSGASGVGKTAFIASMIAALQRGDPLFGHPTNCPPAIGVLVCDRPWRDHLAWFQKAGCADLPHLSLRDIDGYDWNVLRDPRKIPTIFASLVDQIQLPPGSLLIVDPLPLFVAGRLIDYKDVAIGLGQIDNILKPRQLTMLGVFHVSKQKANKQDRYLRPQDRILGSSALIGYSETAFYLLSPEEADQPAYQFGVIPHQQPPQTLLYDRDADGLFTPYKPDAMDTLQQDILALAQLPSDGSQVSSNVLVGLIRTACGGSERNASRLIGRLIDMGQITKVRRGRYVRSVVEATH